LLLSLLDVFFLLYEVSHGLNLAQSSFSSSIPIPLEWLPVIGVVLLSLVTWYEAYYRIFPRRGLEVDPLARIRLVRAILFSLTLFVLVLYVPALVRSSWFWATLGGTGKSITQLRDFDNSLLKSVRPLLTFDLIWQYASFQVLASLVMVLGAWAFARPTRRVRK
jgi:hypothetical protein